MFTKIDIQKDETLTKTDLPMFYIGINNETNLIKTKIKKSEFEYKQIKWR